MAVSEKQKGYAAKWDKANMKTVSARFRVDEYNTFKEYCESIGKTPSTVVKEFVRECIKSYDNNENK